MARQQSHGPSLCVVVPNAYRQGKYNAQTNFDDICSSVATPLTSSAKYKTYTSVHFPLTRQITQVWQKLGTRLGYAALAVISAAAATRNEAQHKKDSDIAGDKRRTILFHRVDRCCQQQPHVLPQRQFLFDIPKEELDDQELQAWLTNVDSIPSQSVRAQQSTARPHHHPMPHFLPFHRRKGQ